ncbi:endonuclease domain-containing 1 protein-like [Emydura macquarii macquarii]|uniref:endonuclease domain-containing 1 protein-like n=1 Tax=Emydura macquarii macquarii TaxID=1129001 RepID=UPI00352A9F22
MGPFALLGFASLWAGLALAEVVSDFSECNKYFYNGAEPKGFDQQNGVNICQRYGNEYHFATFYDKSNRIPVWSAYSIREGNCTDKKPIWMVEPQLSGFNEKDMRTKTKKDGNLKTNQAVNEDYDKTGYDRGHLNPNSFQCDKGQIATFTLTNAVSEDPCFNRVHWYELERNLKYQLKNECSDLDGKPFLVTGAVPNPKYRIPNKDDDDSRDIKRDAGRVVVPSHIWTAVCCNHSNNNEKFSFAFMGINKPDSILKAMEVTELNKELTKLYKKSSIEIFNDNCNEGSTKSTEVLKKITKELRSSFPHWDDEAGPLGGKRPRLSSGRKRKSLSGSGSSLEGGGREAA